MQVSTHYNLTNLDIYLEQTSVATDQVGRLSVKPNVNLEVSGEYNIGCALESDTKQLTAIRPQFVWTPSWTGMAWLRADIKEKAIMSGCYQKYDWFCKMKVASEAIYGYS